MKIIAGKHKNQVIPVLKGSNYRPSTGKIREAIFSILTSGKFAEQEIFNDNTSVLDLFAGTGSLSFEALSRGAVEVTLVDINANHLKLAKKFAISIGEEENSNFLNISATNLPKATKNFDLVFIDPPYYNNLVKGAVNSLKTGKWLKDSAILVIESAKTDDFSDDSCQLIKEKIYGDTKLLVLRYKNPND
ncbi:MAG: 16S rRNA (guanine(966)-N(2))-methyltransferase RsmD [Candidatus Rickettsia vulgarisii]